MNCLADDGLKGEKSKKAVKVKAGLAGRVGEATSRRLLADGADLEDGPDFGQAGRAEVAARLLAAQAFSGE
jgi:hypothetical protein